MKKTTIIAGLALLLSAAVHAQTDTTKTQVPVTTTSEQTQPATTVSKDKYNNWSADTYKMQPMPEALTTEKIFPVIGKYQLTDKDGATADVTVTLDEANKGLVWIDGLPQGRIKASLRKSPAVYKIPAQTLGEGKEAKNVAEGVLIYDKDANTMNVCIGCTYNAEDPAVAFTPAAEPVVEEVAKTKTKATKTKTKTTVAKVKPVMYSGSKVIEGTAAVVPAQQ